MAGVEVLYQLRRRARGRALRVGIVDLQEGHGYIPLCHERLSGRLSDAAGRLHTAGYVDAAAQAEMIIGRVVQMDPEARLVGLDDGRVLSAEQIVVALGSVTTPAPRQLPGVHLARTVKFDRDAQEVRGLLQALRAPNGPEQPRVVVVGGGITGVELAGELAWMSARSDDLRRPFEVTLVHGGERLLPALTPRAGELAARHLETQGVDLRVRARITQIREDGVRIEDSVPAVPEQLDMPADLVLWAGGVRPPAVLGDLGVGRDDQGWLTVDPHLRALGTSGAPIPGVFVTGDAAAVVESGRTWPTMKRAIECLWQAKVVAKNLMAARRDRDLTRHRLREDFAHGVSLGARSLVVYGGLVVDRPRVNTWFRRFLMRRYFARYGAR